MIKTGMIKNLIKLFIVILFVSQFTYLASHAYAQTSSVGIQFVVNSGNTRIEPGQEFNVEVKVHPQNQDLTSIALDVDLSNTFGCLVNVRGNELVDFTPVSSRDIALGNQGLTEDQTTDNLYHFVGTLTNTRAPFTGNDYIKITTLHFKAHSTPQSSCSIPLSDFNVTKVGVSGFISSDQPSAVTFSIEPPAPTPTSTPSPTSMPEVETTGFKIAESSSLDGDDINWDELLIIPQDQYKGKYSYEFKAKTCRVDDTDCVSFPRGIRNICVKFYHSNNTSSDSFCSSISLVPKPVISSVSCNLNSSGAGTVVTVKGANFGTDPGAMRIGSRANNLERIDIPAGGWTNNQVVANLNSQLEGAKFVRLTVAEDYSARDSLCQIGLSQISFKASLACRSLDKPLTSAALEVSDFQSGGSVYKNDKNTFDAEGIPVGLFPKIEEGRDYKISIRAPSTLKRTIFFKAARGTTVLSAFNLPVGDISPEVGDGLINARDFSTLKSQWTLISDTQKRADLNLDGRVNSLDYSCLVSNFNKSNEEVDQRPRVIPPPQLPGIDIIPSPTISAGIGTTEPATTSGPLVPPAPF